MRLNPAFIFPVLLFASAFVCNKPDPAATSTTWTAYQSPAITKISLYDTLPANSLKHLSLKEIHGVQVIYKNGKRTRYFEYDTDADSLLRIINTLPFVRTNQITDTTYRAIPFPFSISVKHILSLEEVEASGFFWNIQPADYLYYECSKTPATHTILISKTTGRILHRIEYES